MAKYIRNPVEVDAVQWFPGVKIPSVGEMPVSKGVVRGYLFTLHLGEVVLKPGDWVITDGAVSLVCEAEAFDRLYKEVPCG